MDRSRRSAHFYSMIAHLRRIINRKKRSASHVPACALPRTCSRPVVVGVLCSASHVPACTLPRSCCRPELRAPCAGLCLAAKHTTRIEKFLYPVCKRSNRQQGCCRSRSRHGWRMSGVCVSYCKHPLGILRISDPKLSLRGKAQAGTWSAEHTIPLRTAACPGPGTGRRMECRAKTRLPARPREGSRA